MDMVLEIISFALLGLGSVILIVGGIGLVRLGDVFARIHAAGLIDTLGVVAVMGGLMIQAGLGIVSIKLVLIVIFILLTSPTATHALARAALNGGVKPQVGGAGGETTGQGEDRGEGK